MYLSHFFTLGIAEVFKFEDLLPDACIDLTKFSDAKREGIVDNLHAGGVIGARSHATIDTHAHRVSIELRVDRAAGLLQPVYLIVRHDTNGICLLSGCSWESLLRFADDTYCCYTFTTVTQSTLSE